MFDAPGLAPITQHGLRPVSLQVYWSELVTRSREPGQDGSTLVQLSHLVVRHLPKVTCKRITISGKTAYKTLAAAVTENTE